MTPRVGCRLAPVLFAAVVGLANPNPLASQSDVNVNQHSCTACHGSHAPRQGASSLRLGNVASFINRPGTAGPGEASSSCLRCHSTPQARMANTSSEDAAPLLPGRGTYLGIDLSDDHSLGRIEDLRRAPLEAGSGGLRSRERLAVGPLGRRGFESSPVECTACHDPHDDRKLTPTGDEQVELCGSCHEPVTYAFEMHMTVGCSGCHDMHEGRTGDLLLGTDRTTFCTTCHSGGTGEARARAGSEAILASGPVGHAVPPAGRCVDCHPPHSRGADLVWP